MVDASTSFLCPILQLATLGSHAAVMHAFPHAQQTNATAHTSPPISISLGSLPLSFSQSRLRITTLPPNDAKRAPSPPKHGPHIMHQVLRLLPREEMAAPIPALLVHDVPLRARPAAGQDAELARVVAQADLDVRDVLAAALARDARGRIVPFVRGFVVDAYVGGGARGAEPVDGEPGEDFVFCPWRWWRRVR